MNTTPTVQFDPKDPEEIVPITFDFEHLTTAPVNPVIVVTRHSGAADANPAALLSGSPLVVGAEVRQRVQGGVDQANYVLRCRVDDAQGNRWVLAAKLPVRAAV